MRLAKLAGRPVRHGRPAHPIQAAEQPSITTSGQQRMSPRKHLPGALRLVARWTDGGEDIHSQHGPPAAAGAAEAAFMKSRR